jgi:hypothetical protein
MSPWRLKYRLEPTGCRMAAIHMLDEIVDLWTSPGLC